MKNNLLSLVIVLVFSSLTFAQNKIVLTVSGVSANNGSIMVALYNSESSFMETVFKQSKTEFEGNLVEIFFEDVPNGEYAISMFQDEDDDGELTIGMFGPKEPYGFSNNAKGSFGPAKFKDAKFEMKDVDVHLEIEIE